MDIKLGPCIASLRRAKSATQEQLVLSLGVPPPVINRWGTGASCPDISLLYPLVRALEANVDTLLQSEETLTEEQTDTRLNEIAEIIRNYGYEATDGTVQSFLYTYPSSVPLKSRAVTLFDLFVMLFPAQPQEIRDGWMKQKKQLLEDVRASGVVACWQAAIPRLAPITISEGELEKAGSLLKELPQHTTDSTSVWAILYLRKGEALQASEVIQKRLYVLTRQIQNFLIQTMSPEMTPDAARTLELCVIYHQPEELLGAGNGTGPGFFTQAHRWAGQDQQALGSVIRFMDAITDAVQKPSPILFSPAVEIDGERPAAIKEMRGSPLKSPLDDGYYKQFHDNKRFMDTADKLRGSTQEDIARTFYMEKEQPLGKNTCQTVLYTFFISSLHIFYPTYLGGLLSMSPHNCFCFTRISSFQAVSNFLAGFNPILIPLLLRYNSSQQNYLPKTHYGVNETNQQRVSNCFGCTGTRLDVIVNAFIPYILTFNHSL